MKLSNKAYDILKDLTTIYLPAAGTLYFGLAEIWGFPYAPEIVATVTCVCTFLGACLKISTKLYREDA